MRPTAPMGAPPPVIVLDAASKNLPKLRQKKAGLQKKIDFIHDQLAKANKEMLELDRAIAKAEAQADVALSALHSQDAQPASGSRTASRSSHQRSRSPKPVGLVKASDPEEKTQKLAIWPPGAKRR